jgi:hypothetical protein
MSLDAKKVRELFIDRQGPTSAAWMVFVNRSSFHKSGAFDFVLRAGEKLPRWAEYGIALLRKRTRWTVLEFKAGDKTIFRVTWKHWRRYVPPVAKSPTELELEKARERAGRNSRKRLRKHQRVVR